MSLKNEYINNHPGQAIIPFPWEPSSSIKVLPFNYEIPAAPANNLSITSCRNRFESASFIITAQKNTSGIGIHISNLSNAQGIQIPSDAVNIHLVKVWYQASEGNIEYEKLGNVLVPELLLKDDTLIKVDYVNRTNYLRVTINGSQQYIDISTPTAKFPKNAEVYDAASLQPFSLKTNENKQIWLTVHIPATTQAGDYCGNITMTTPTESTVIINFCVTVLPFDLEPPPIQYGLFYRGILNTTPTNGLGSEWKSPVQYTAELQNMKDHGISYPTLYQEDDTNIDAPIDTVLTIRNSIGFPTDKIYIIPSSYGSTSRIGNATAPAGLTEVANTVINWRNHTETYGFTDTYFFGMDEVGGELLLSQRPAWQTVHNNGGKMMAASWIDDDDLLIKVGDILDEANIGVPINTTKSTLWHNYGHKIFLYNQPQVGIENPELYRRNYGFALWNSGYDGTMNYAYQHGFGQSIWNDFDDNLGTHYRDHVFAYPTSNGVIDTIQWEGWREGVDDTRYLATLMKMEGSDTSARAIVSDSLSKGEHMATIREKIIAQILITSPSTNKQPTIGIYRNGVFYLKNSNTGGPANLTFGYGIPSDIPVVGDWNGDGINSIGIYRNGAFYLRNSNSAGHADLAFSYGLSTDTPIVGDWNGDGIDTIGIYRNGAFYLKNSNSAGLADLAFGYGISTDTPVVGDWNGDGTDTIGIYRNGAFYLRNSNSAGLADLAFGYGIPGDKPVVGDWDGI